MKIKINQNNSIDFVEQRELIVRGNDGANVIQIEAPFWNQNSLVTASFKRSDSFIISHLTFLKEQEYWFLTIPNDSGILEVNGELQITITCRVDNKIINSTEVTALVYKAVAKDPSDDDWYIDYLATKLIEIESRVNDLESNKADESDLAIAFSQIRGLQTVDAQIIDGRQTVGVANEALNYQEGGNIESGITTNATNIQSLQEQANNIIDGTQTVGNAQNAIDFTENGTISQNFTTVNNKITEIVDGTQQVGRAVLADGFAPNSPGNEQIRNIQQLLILADRNKLDKLWNNYVTAQNLADTDYFIINTEDPDNPDQMLAYRVTVAKMKEILGGGGENLYLGVYPSLEALTTAHPNPLPGSSAYILIDMPSGRTLIEYVYDAESGEWISTGTGQYVTTIDFNAFQTGLMNGTIIVNQANTSTNYIDGEETKNIATEINQLSDYNNLENIPILKVNVMPTTPSNMVIYQWIGETNESYTNGNYYRWINGEFQEVIMETYTKTEIDAKTPSDIVITAPYPPRNGIYPSTINQINELIRPIIISKTFDGSSTSRLVLDETKYRNIILQIPESISVKAYGCSLIRYTFSSNQILTTDIILDFIYTAGNIIRITVRSNNTGTISVLPQKQEILNVRQVGVIAAGDARSLGNIVRSYADPSSTSRFIQYEVPLFVLSLPADNPYGQYKYFNCTSYFATGSEYILTFKGENFGNYILTLPIGATTTGLLEFITPSPIPNIYINSTNFNMTDEQKAAALLSINSIISDNGIDYTKFNRIIIRNTDTRGLLSDLEITTVTSIPNSGRPSNVYLWGNLVDITEDVTHVLLLNFDITNQTVTVTYNRIPIGGSGESTIRLPEPQLDVGLFNDYPNQPTNEYGFKSGYYIRATADVEMDIVNHLMAGNTIKFVLYRNIPRKKEEMQPTGTKLTKGIRKSNTATEENVLYMGVSKTLFIEPNITNNIIPNLPNLFLNGMLPIEYNITLTNLLINTAGQYYIELWIDLAHLLESISYSNLKNNTEQIFVEPLIRKSEMVGSIERFSHFESNSTVNEADLNTYKVCLTSFQSHYKVYSRVATSNIFYSRAKFLTRFEIDGSTNKNVSNYSKLLTLGLNSELKESDISNIDVFAYPFYKIG